MARIADIRRHTGVGRGGRESRCGHLIIGW